MSLAWKVIQVLFFVLKIVVEQYRKDPTKFKAELGGAMTSVKNAQTEEEMKRAAQAVQDTLFR